MKETIDFLKNPKVEKIILKSILESIIISVIVWFCIYSDEIIAAANALHDIGFNLSIILWGLPIIFIAHCTIEMGKYVINENKSK